MKKFNEEIIIETGINNGAISTDSDDLVVKSSEACGMTILSGDGKRATLAFANKNDPKVAEFMFYYDTLNNMAPTAAVGTHVDDGVLKLLSGSDGAAINIDAKRNIQAEGKIKIKEYTPNQPLNPGSTANARSDSDDLVLDSSGTNGLSILSGTGSIGNISFGDGDDACAAQVQYNHSNNVMTIGTHEANGQLNLSSGNASVRWVIESEGNLSPDTDNTLNFGGADNRVKQIFAANGSISTSDSRTKSAERDLNNAEINAAVELAKIVKIYQHKDAVNAKGRTEARLHTGVIAQEVISTMKSHGLNPFQYGFVCYDEWDDVFENRIVNSGEKIKKTRTIQVPVTKKVMNEVTHIEIINGIPTQITKVIEVDEKQYEEVGVIDENGNQVMVIDRQVENAISNKNGHELNSDSEKRYKPLTHKVVKMKTVIEEYEEDAEPVFEKVQIKKAGNRYGIRYDELSMFILGGIIQKQNKDFCEILGVRYEES